MTTSPPHDAFKNFEKSLKNFYLDTNLIYIANGKWSAHIYHQMPSPQPSLKKWVDFNYKSPQAIVQDMQKHNIEVEVAPNYSPKWWKVVLELNGKERKKNLPTFSSSEPLQIVALPTYSTTTPCGL